MKPDQALKLIDQYLVQLQLTRSQHAQLIEAVQVLNTLVVSEKKESK